ncbi:MAG: GNAT family N-acetyltransferase [Candidatus Acidiferrales bacterium]
MDLPSNPALDGAVANAPADRSPAATTNNPYFILHEFPVPAQEAAWSDLLTRVELPSHFLTPEFFLESQWEGKRPFAVLAVQNEMVVAALTGVHEDVRVECGMSTRPQICFDRKADLAGALDSLAAGLFVEAGSAQLISIYSWVPLDPLVRHGFRRREMRGVVTLDLTLGKDELFKRFDLPRRNNIRRSAKKGVEVYQASTPEDIAAYYEVYKSWSDSKAFHTRSFEEWRLASASTPANRRLFLARAAGKAIAGGVLRFCPRGLVEASENNSLHEFLHLKPNDLLQWKEIEWACDEGFPLYTLGAAGTFHRGFGEVVTPVFRYRLDRTLFRRHDLRENLSETATKAFQKLPPSVSNVARRLLGKKLLPPKPSSDKPSPGKISPEKPPPESKLP